MTFDLTRRGMIAGATASVPTLAFAQNKPQFAPISTVASLTAAFSVAAGSRIRMVVPTPSSL